MMGSQIIIANRKAMSPVKKNVELDVPLNREVMTWLGVFLNYF